MYGPLLLCLDVFWGLIMRILSCCMCGILVCGSSLPYLCARYVVHSIVYFDPVVIVLLQCLWLLWRNLSLGPIAHSACTIASSSNSTFVGYLQGVSTSLLNSLAGRHPTLVLPPPFINAYLKPDFAIRTGKRQEGIL